jgi:hypothetical protein
MAADPSPQIAPQPISCHLPDQQNWPPRNKFRSTLLRIDLSPRTRMRVFSFVSGQSGDRGVLGAMAGITKTRW